MTGPWPTPADDAVFHGLAGEFVALTEPHSEAHPMALLAQFLVAFGAACGRGAHYPVEASRHHPNEFCVLVGPSAKGRKGSSWDHVEACLAATDAAFVDGGLVAGLSSGEGLIAHVRDAADEDDSDAPDDKRRLVLEQEFAQVLKVLAREGNTLSPVVRQAWDGKPLQTMVRHSPLRAREAHIAIIGHITRDELLRYLNATELANGFFNRFLLIAVDRSKLLPFGGTLRPAALTAVSDRLRAAVRFAQTGGPLTFDDHARERWIAAYPVLSRGEAGLLGAATARAEAHTVRLALLYALLDSSPAIRLPHLEAALAVWTYSYSSARWIFGDSLGDPTADDIWALAKDRADGVTRTEVRDLFSRNKKAREIDRALSALVDAGRLMRTSNADGHGRPAEVWVPTERAA
jgi:hypothetical protein